MIGTCGTKDQYTTPSSDVPEHKATQPSHGYRSSPHGGQGPGHASCEYPVMFDDVVRKCKKEFFFNYILITFKIHLNYFAVFCSYYIVIICYYTVIILLLYCFL